MSKKVINNRRLQMFISRSHVMLRVIYFNFFVVRYNSSASVTLLWENQTKIKYPLIIGQHFIYNHEMLVLVWFLSFNKSDLRNILRLVILTVGSLFLAHWNPVSGPILKLKKKRWTLCKKFWTVFMLRVMSSSVKCQP